MAKSKSNEIIIIGKMDHTLDNTYESANRVYSKDGICPSISTCAGGNLQPKIIDELKTIVAMRGRNPENPSDRTAGAKTEQRLELNGDGVCNTLTSVQKDNLLLEEKKINKIGQISNEGSQCGTVVSDDGLFPTISAGTHGYANPHICTKSTKPECIKIKQATKQGYIECKAGGVADFSYPESKLRRGRVQGGGDMSPTLTSSNLGVCKVESCYRIRKLTPKECFRLMAVTDDDADKMLAVNSNSQCYKQAGNSIVVSVLEAIFRQLNIKGVENWNKAKGEYGNVRNSL